MADPIVKKVTDLIAADSVAADDLIVIVDVSEAIAANKTKKALARLITLYNSTQITDGIVINSKIANGAVTAVKLATDAVETAKIKDANVTTAKIADGAVTADKLATNAVETAKIKDGAVTAGKLANGAVTNAKIANSAVTADKLATNAVETAKIKDANVTTAKIADGAVTADKLATNAVETAKIKDGAVTAGKLANGVVIPHYVGKFYRDGTLPDSSYILPAGWSITHVGSGRYRITHNFNSSGYAVVAMGEHAATVSIPVLTTNNFELAVTSPSGATPDEIIHFVVFKF